MDVKVKEEEGVEGAVVQPCRLPLCSIPACMDASDSGGWRYALAVSLDEQSFGRQAAWRRHALKRNLNASSSVTSWRNCLNIG